jgi:hypothetical protein
MLDGGDALLSEYQYYQFQSIDRPLTDRQMGELRAISTRADITPTSFVNVYHWGDLKARPLDLMKKYFDAHLYVANWGTRCLMLKVARDLVDVDAARQYCADETMSLHLHRDYVIFVFTSNDDYHDDWDSGERWLPSLLPLRDDLSRGDSRSLYLGWLAGIWEEDNQLEPPIPPGLSQLSGAIQTLMDFLYLDPHLVTSAAKQDSGSPPSGPSDAEITDWVAQLPAADKDELVAKLLSGGDTTGDFSVLRRRFQKEWNEKHTLQSSVADPTRRTAAEIFQVARELTEEANRREAERHAREEVRRKRKTAAERKRYLESLAPKADKIWADVELLLGTNNQKNYDQAVKWLRDLGDLATTVSSDADTWEDRVRELRRRHSRKSSLMKRFDKASFP